MSQKERAIGIFDSGVGGLTVCGTLTRKLPNERVIYLGDTARLPYGTKSPEVVRRYAERCAEFLLTHEIKLLVIACNTASAHALEHLQRQLPVPVVGVIAPGARRALSLSRNRRIGVIGTSGTIKSGAYRRALEALEPSAEVIEAACPLFVPLAEEGWTEHPAAKLIAEEYLAPLRARTVDTLVLGCTHYPVLREVIASAMGPEVTLCDAAEAVAEEVRALLGPNAASTVAGPHRFFLTDVQPQFLGLAARFFGAPISEAERIDL